MPDKQHEKEVPPSEAWPELLALLQQWAGSRSEGHPREAERVFERIAAAATASDFDRLHQLGIDEAIAGNSAAAIAVLDLALRVNPASAAAHCHRGNALRDLQRHADALDSYDRAVELDHAYAIALNNRGVTFQDMGRHEDALASCHAAALADPDYAAAFYNRGNALQALERHAEALESYARAIDLKPDYVKALTNRGNAFYALKRYEEALDCYDRAVSLEPNPAEALNNRGNLLREIGELDAALQSHRTFLAANSGAAFAHHALIFTLLRASSNPAEVSAQCRAFEQQIGRRAARLPHRNTPVAGRKLKVGYVSGDFREHPVAFHIEPILANHDTAAFDIYCYSNHRQDDAVTHRLRALSAHWRCVADLSDDELASAVQEDAIDILVDLAGHTTHSRLAAFARKPAPVQVTWVGLPATTGLSSIDYRLTDQQVDPIGMTEAHHSERLVRLSSHACYAAPAALPPVNDLPALKRGYITFGSFNSLDKITPRTYSLWSRVLANVPQSRLLMICDPAASELIARRFAALGVGPERLLFVRKLPMVDYLRWHHTVDIALDTFPFNGGTITRNALWMGVPVITLTGSVPVSRVGLALMTQIGLEGFTAAFEDQYVAIAKHWAGDLEALAAIRRALRKRMEAAPFSDGEAYTRELEAAYRQMWREWCEP